MTQGNDGVHRLHLLQAFFHLLPDLFLVAIKWGVFALHGQLPHDKTRSAALQVLDRLFKLSVGCFQGEFCALTFQGQVGLEVLLALAVFSGGPLSVVNERADDG